MKNQEVIQTASKLDVKETKQLNFEAMKLLVIIVPAGSGNVFINFNKTTGVALQILDRGSGTVPIDLLEILGLDDNKKDIVFAVATATALNKILPFIEQRFIIAKKEKGIAFTIPLRALIGLTNYKYLTNSPKTLGGKVYE